MNKQKVKVYGLINMTKSIYIKVQITVLFLTAGLVISSLFLDFSQSSSLLLKNMTIITLIILILEAIEMRVMLKKFENKAAVTLE